MEKKLYMIEYDANNKYNKKGSFFVEGLSLLGQTQLISFSGKKTDPEFNLQIADSHGNGGLGHI